MMGRIIQKAEDRKLAIPYSSEFYILEFSTIVRCALFSFSVFLRFLCCEFVIPIVVSLCFCGS